MYKVPEKLLDKHPHFPLLEPIAEVNRLKFLGKVKSFFTYRRKWKTHEDCCFWSNEIQKFIFIPVDFIFDGASVPKALNGLYSSTGILFHGAIAHDFGYRYGGLFLVNEDGELEFRIFSKGKLDDIFLDLCRQENDMPNVSKIAKSTLSMFGFMGWNENRKNNLDVNFDYWFLF